MDLDNSAHHALAEPGSFGARINDYKKEMFRPVNQDVLKSTIERERDSRIASLTVLDFNVFRIDWQDNETWVARVFPSARSIDCVEGDAAILRFLQEQNFPAEQCAQKSVCAFGDRGILLTKFAGGSKARKGEKTLGKLGAMLGRLHGMSGDAGAITRPGGAWHHFCPQGVPRDEKAKAETLLADIQQYLPSDQHSNYELLRNEVSKADDCHDLPHALTHPDFVLSNVISKPSGGLVVIDWTGAGIGPRIITLGFLLWAAGCRDITKADAVIAGYSVQISLEPDEITRLYGAIQFKPLFLLCWEVLMERKQLGTIAEELDFIRKRAGEIKERVHLAMARGRT